MCKCKIYSKLPLDVKWGSVSCSENRTYEQMGKPDTTASDCNNEYDIRHSKYKHYRKLILDYNIVFNFQPVLFL